MLPQNSSIAKGGFLSLEEIPSLVVLKGNLFGTVATFGTNFLQRDIWFLEELLLRRAHFATEHSCHTPNQSTGPESSADQHSCANPGTSKRLKAGAKYRANRRLFGVQTLRRIDAHSADDGGQRGQERKHEYS